jgi:hypothetical protein
MHRCWLLVILHTACDPCAGPSYLTFALEHHGMLSDGTPTFGSNAPRWGSIERASVSDGFLVLFGQYETLAPDVLELYDASSRRVTFVGQDMFVPTDVEGCAHNERQYTFAALQPGDYLLVHRRKNGTGHPLNCIEPGCPWTTYAGDEAVTLTLAIR